MKYSEEVKKEILDYISKGANNKDVCGIMGISTETFYTWIKEKPDFSDAVKRAVELRKVSMVNRVLTAAKRSWQAAAWYLERQYYEEFGRREKIEFETAEQKIKRAMDIIERDEQISKDSSGVLQEQGGQALPPHDGSE